MSEPNDCVDRLVSGEHGPGCKCRCGGEYGTRSVTPGATFTSEGGWQNGKVLICERGPDVHLIHRDREWWWRDGENVASNEPAPDTTPIPLDLADRLAAVEARQRAYGMHDPGCTSAKSVFQLADEGMYYVERRCDCWLSREAS